MTSASERAKEEGGEGRGGREQAKTGEATGICHCPSNGVVSLYNMHS